MSTLQITELLRLQYNTDKSEPEFDDSCAYGLLHVEELIEAYVVDDYVVTGIRGHWRSDDCINLSGPMTYRWVDSVRWEVAK